MSGCGLETWPAPRPSGALRGDLKCSHKQGLDAEDAPAWTHPARLLPAAPGWATLITLALRLA